MQISIDVRTAVTFFLTWVSGFAASWLIERGWLGADQKATFITNAVVVAFAAPAAFGWLVEKYFRPSQKAMEVAKELDKTQATTPVVKVTLETPKGQPDVVIPVNIKDA